MKLHVAATHVQHRKWQLAEEAELVLTPDAIRLHE